MKILVIGGGGREHAVIRKLMESSRVDKIYCAPGNGGIGCDAENVPIQAMDTAGIVNFAKKNGIGLVCVT
ncbi:MAG TPA: phosphoribosylamine--glycine ligase, partial [Ruminococcaceae bacterium]|nr:phosphoribosylamine--glycine ligase [Oscillospiraceae bacterium]